MSAHADTPTLQADSREVTGKQVKQLRNSGLVPAVLYGQEQPTTSLSLDAATFTKLYHQVGNTTLINLTVDKKAPVKVLVHDVQINPVHRSITHVDFYQVNLKEKLRTEIPLSYVGTSDAVEVEGGIFIAVKNEVNVECLPEDLVHEIEVDISSLKAFNDSLHVKDIKAPNGIVILDEADEMLASITEPRSQEEIDALDEPVEATVDVESETQSGTDDQPAEGEENGESEEKKEE